MCKLAWSWIFISMPTYTRTELRDGVVTTAGITTGAKTFTLINDITYVTYFVIEGNTFKPDFFILPDDMAYFYKIGPYEGGKGQGKYDDDYNFPSYDLPMEDPLDFR